MDKKYPNYRTAYLGTIMGLTFLIVSIVFALCFWMGWPAGFAAMPIVIRQAFAWFFTFTAISSMFILFVAAGKHNPDPLNTD